ncbi:MAG TPA: DNA gyrase inhibitor YacG [Casimicrobiaceae bacterium]|nr:DNA gyrase inhibitor YacG [Casimicrobiaceae bacterium]
MSEQQERAARTVHCPQCGKPVAWTAESTWRPFCSERCKTLDLGGWLSERYRIPLDEASGESAPDAPPGEAGRDDR